MAKAVTSKTESLTVRMPVDLMAELRAEAADAGTSVGSVVVGKARGGKADVSPDLGPVVYFLRAGDDGPVKIGWSKNLSSRIGDVQLGSPVRLSLIRTISCESWVERWFHEEFEDSRLIGEWFSFDKLMLTLDAPAENPKPLVADGRKNFRLRIRTFKVSDEMWKQWQARAVVACTSVTALIIAAVDGQDMRGRRIPALQAEPSAKPIDLDALEREWRRKWERERPSTVAGDKPVSTLNLLVLTDFPKRDAMKPGKGKKA